MNGRRIHVDSPIKISRMREKNKLVCYGGAWVAQSVEHPTSAQVMISRFVSSSPMSGSVLTAQSLEPAPDSVSSSLSDPHLILCVRLSLSLSFPHSCSLSLSVSPTLFLKNK